MGSVTKRRQSATSCSGSGSDASPRNGVELVGQAHAFFSMIVGSHDGTSLLQCASFDLVCPKFDDNKYEQYRKVPELGFHD